MPAPATLLPRGHPHTLRAAAWTLRAVRVAQRTYAQPGVRDVTLPAVPDLPPGAVRGVNAVLHRTGQRCLVRATVRQAWQAAHGDPRELVIGVTPPSAGFKAHAWLDGDPPCHAEGYTELLRR